jgi:hypothetical protein
MYMEHPYIHVRAAKRADASALCDLLNKIIGIGGTQLLILRLLSPKLKDIFSPAQTSSPAI